MALQCGIVGLPNVGKSTLFNALTKAQIDAANYPFCTIEPNTGIVTVPDPRLDAITKVAVPQKTIPTTTEFVDIAGLVEGASKGEGLGNKFLSHIRDTQAICHVVRCFDNPDITHVAGKVNPAHDVAIINLELILADLESIEKAIWKQQKIARSGDKSAKQQVAMLEKAKLHLEQEKPIRTLQLTADELNIIKHYHLITIKPVLYIANVDEQGFENNPYLTELEKIAAAENTSVVAVCAAIEAELSELDDEDKKEFLAEMNLAEPGLNRVIRAGYQLLDLQTYFTAGKKEVRAWTFPRNATAPQAAGVIHSDFEKGFIRAEIISYDDYIQYNGEQGAKDAGKWRLEGKDYIVKDGDIIHFRFNV